MAGEQISSVKQFVVTSRENGHIWGLHNENGWVICQSELFNKSEVIPFWSSKDAAASQCVEEWQNLKPEAIAVDDFVNRILVELAQDAILLGPDWDRELRGEEIEPSEMVAEYLNEKRSHQTSNDFDDELDD